MELDFVTILPFTVCIAAALGVWAIGDFVMNRRSRAESRLDVMTRKLTNRSDSSLDDRSGLTKLLEAASPTLSESLTPKSDKEINNLKQRLNYAGFRSENALPIFVTIKGICAMAAFVLAGGITLVLNGINMWTMIYTLTATGIALFIPEFALSFLISRRKQNLFLGLPDALDLMVVCVEAGLGLDQAMRRVADEMSQTHREIAHEFKICNQALQMGRGRTEVLQDLGDRNGVDDLKTLAQIMIQVDRFGTSIGVALRTQSDTMRTRRRQLAEEKAAKTAVKLIFPLVLFIFPGIFVVLVGPAAITMINEMLPAMGR